MRTTSTKGQIAIPSALRRVHEEDKVELAAAQQGRFAIIGRHNAGNGSKGLIRRFGTQVIHRSNESNHPG